MAAEEGATRLNRPDGTDPLEEASGCNRKHSWRTSTITTQ